MCVCVEGGGAAAVLVSLCVRRGGGGGGGGAVVVDAGDVAAGVHCGAPNSPTTVGSAGLGGWAMHANQQCWMHATM